MAFQIANLAPHSNYSNTLPVTWGYLSTENTFVEMQAANFFDGAARKIKAGDAIYARDTSNGNAQFANVTSVSAAGVVVISDFAVLGTA